MKKAKNFNIPKPKEWRASELSQLKFARYEPLTQLNGEGNRCAIYVSGCKFACKGCFNKAIQNFNYGEPYTDEIENQILKDLEKSYIQGLSLLGGEPMLNTQILIRLCEKVREKFGNKKDIWIWSGYTFEQIQLEKSDKNDESDKIKLLNLCDILVDGVFDRDKKDPKLQFRGSSNQRIIDINKTRERGEVVIWEKLKY